MKIVLKQLGRIVHISGRFIDSSDSPITQAGHPTHLPDHLYWKSPRPEAMGVVTPRVLPEGDGRWSRFQLEKVVVDRPSLLNSDTYAAVYVR